MGEFVDNYLSRYELAPDELHDIAIKAEPMMGLYTYERSKGSESMTVRFTLRGPRGFSRTLAQAQQISGVKRNSEYFRYTIPYGKMEGSILFSLEELVKSEADPEYGADFLERNTEAGIAGFAQNISYQLNSVAGGSVGTATFHSAASGARPVFSLNFSTTPEAIAGLMPGDQVEISVSDGTSASHSTIAAAGLIIDRDTDNGFLQVAAISAPATAANPGGWDDTGATTYYVYRLGEMHRGVPQDTVLPWSSFIPLTRSTSELLGVNRALEAFLSGSRLLGTSENSGTFARRVKRLLAKNLARLGADRAQIGKSQTLMLHPEDWDTFEDQQSSRVGRDVEKVAVDGYEAIQVRTAQGVINTIAEPTMTKGLARLNSFKMCRIAGPTGKLINLFTYGMGNGMLRAKEGSNDAELRPYFIGAHGVGNPCAHGVFALTG
ncbi:MAG: hypothetical protein A2V88_15375 [Elusimicrobia bacterium RBG_16_66_12]|nr:MAG: hypothetical protein A2V88_15375 [Elusimicrobia bacterium RBG_16_66_12]